jgi:hypothetical protein
MSNEKKLLFKRLDALIEEHKDDAPLKKGLLILKSGCQPYKEEGIPKRKAVKVITTAKSGEESLALGFADEDDEPMMEYHDSIAKGLARVIEVCYERE